jgi:sulfane dehydrogenase subunit SoxC
MAMETNENQTQIASNLHPGEEITLEELQLATRNHGMPLEALRYPITPLGLHYLLIHYDIPHVALDRWRLKIGGRVENRLSLTLDEIRQCPRVERPVTFECAGNGRALLSPRPVNQPWLVEAVGTGEWTGTKLGPLLEEAGVTGDVVEFLFTGLDRGVEGGVEQSYERSLPAAEALDGDALLVYELNGEPLPPQHGFPLRLLVPGWYGMANVKWLESVTALTKPFRGYQQMRAYRVWQTRDTPGEPLSRMMPRALMLPPGIPDFLSRTRIVPPGPCELEGKAWSGWGAVIRVDVTCDDGETWREAELGDAVSAHAWRPWRLTWTPDREGTYRLGCRAADDSKRSQPTGSSWNLKGYANNEVHWMDVEVRRNTRTG